MGSDDPPPGVPEWVVTYGDMMSLLLTFFIMLVSLSEVKADKKFRAVLESLHKQVGYMTGPIAPPGEQFPLNSDVPKLETLGGQTSNSAKGGIRSRATPEGNDFRTTVLRGGKSAGVGLPIVFGETETTPLAIGVDRLAEISRELMGKPNKVELQILVGTSATLPEIERAWARLDHTRLQLVDRGVDGRRFRLRVRYDDQATLQSDPLAQPQHAVEVVMLDLFQQEYVGPREAGGPR